MISCSVGHQTSVLVLSVDRREAGFEITRLEEARVDPNSLSTSKKYPNSILILNILSRLVCRDVRQMLPSPNLVMCKKKGMKRKCRGEDSAGGWSTRHSSLPLSLPLFSNPETGRSCSGGGNWANTGRQHCPSAAEATSAYPGAEQITGKYTSLLFLTHLDETIVFAISL